jgi:hypothetical protein
MTLMKCGVPSSASCPAGPMARVWRRLTVLVGERIDERVEVLRRQAPRLLAYGVNLQDFGRLVGWFARAGRRADDPGRQAQFLDALVHQPRMVLQGEAGILDEDQVADRGVAAPALQQLGRDAMCCRSGSKCGSRWQPRETMLTKLVGEAGFELLDERLEDGAALGGQWVARVAGDLGVEQHLLAG